MFLVRPVHMVLRLSNLPIRQEHRFAMEKQINEEGLKTVPGNSRTLVSTTKVFWRIFEVSDGTASNL